MNIPLRVTAALLCILLGFLFFPLFILGGLIIWSIFADVAEAPAQRAQQAELDARANEPVSVEDIRMACDSPAEEAFLDAMVSAHSLQPGPGAIVGKGLRLRSQVAMGNLKIYSTFTAAQYRADFLIDEKLVVEIDGAAYHSSPEAVERDRQRDDDMRRDGYSILRIPAKVVFQDPADAVARVDLARLALLARSYSQSTPPAAPAAG